MSTKVRKKSMHKFTENTRVDKRIFVDFDNYVLINTKSSFSYRLEKYCITFIIIIIISNYDVNGCVTKCIYVS